MTQPAKTFQSDLILRLGRPIAFIAIAGLTLHIVLRFTSLSNSIDANYPLYIVLILGGIPLIIDLFLKLLRLQFGADLLAGISIVTAVLLDEYLAGSLVVLMLSGGEAIEALALRRASSVLEALAKRMPSIAHRREGTAIVDINTSEILVGDTLSIFPHEICPVDGVVIEGRSTMDEAYLTGEPFQIKKTPGSEVVSGAINGEGALTIKALRVAIESRYAKIAQVMDNSRQLRPQLRRLGDTLGALYTPIAVFIAAVAWIYSGEAVRFLSVLVVATPCPLLIAIPIAIVGSISLAAKRSIIIKDPAILEKLSICKTIIFDKTGTLTYGEPILARILLAPDYTEAQVLRLAGCIEKYSKHPLATAVVKAAEKANVEQCEASDVEELPGQGLSGHVENIKVAITGRSKLSPSLEAELPPQSSGLECIVLLNDKYAATFQFHDEPRPDTGHFLRHLKRHRIFKIILLSGDRESEVNYLAEKVGIKNVYFNKSPEEKVEIVRAESARAPTIFLGDGINDAPALFAATIGIAFGPKSDITSEAAGAVILEPSLTRLDELIHIGTRMRRIALQSAVGGMSLSIVGMGFAAAGLLTPVEGAITQEVIDLAVVINALRAASPRFKLTDF